jgi:hypothetical protein
MAGDGFNDFLHPKPRNVAVQAVQVCTMHGCTPCRGKKITLGIASSAAPGSLAFLHDSLDPTEGERG